MRTRKPKDERTGDSGGADAGLHADALPPGRFDGTEGKRNVDPEAYQAV